MWAGAAAVLGHTEMWATCSNPPHPSFSHGCSEPLRSCWAVGRRCVAMAACTLSALLSSPSLFLFVVLLCSRDEMYFAPGLCLVPSCSTFPSHSLTPVLVSVGRSVVALLHCPVHPQPCSLPHLTLPCLLGFIKKEPISLFLFINIVLLDCCLVFCFVPASSFPLSFLPLTLQPHPSG